MSRSQVPALEPHCGSWICTLEHPDGQSPRLVEVYSRKDAETLAAAGWLVETAAQYLAKFNRAVKLAAERRAAMASFNAEFGI